MTIQYIVKAKHKILSYWQNRAILSFFIVFSFTLFPTYGADNFTLFEDDQKIYLSPHENYEYLLSLAPLVEQQTNEQRILWLQQKAAVEHLLAKTKAFSSSVISARKLLTKNSDVLIKAKLLYYSGIIAQQNNEFNKAAELFLDAISLIDKNTLLFIEIKKSLLFNQNVTEFLDERLNELQLAYIESFSQGNDFIIALINHTYGDLYRYKGDFDTALDYYFKAYETYEQFGYSRHHEQVLYAITLTHRDNGNTKEALEHLKYYEKIKIDKEQQLLVFYGYATIYASLNHFYEASNFTLKSVITPVNLNEVKTNCKKAFFYIQKSLAQEAGFLFKSELLKRKTRCLISFSEYEQAQQVLTKINILYNDAPAFKNTSWQLETLQLAAELAYAQQEYKKAFVLFEQYYEQLLIEQKNRFDFRYQEKKQSLTTERNEIELKLIELRTQYNDLIILLKKYKNLEYKYIFVLLVFLVIVVIGLVIYYKNTEQKLVMLTTKDKLTGLYNRNYMISLCEKLLSNAFKKRKISLLLIEIDNISIVNDLYGYKVRDSILCQFVDVMNECFRIEDTLGRIDCEHFLCLLPRIDEVLAMEIAERLVELVEKYDFNAGNNTHTKMTISVGVRSVEPSLKCDVDILYNELSQALSRAKKLGKNQAVIFRERHQSP